MASVLLKKKDYEEYCERPLFSKQEWSDLCKLIDATDRQAAILSRVLVGDSDKEIAAELELSPVTVQTHIRGLASTMQVDNRTKLITKIFKVFRWSKLSPAENN